MILVLALVLVGCGKTDHQKIEAAIRTGAGKPTGELTKADLEKVTVLTVTHMKITDLKPLAGLTKLEKLLLFGNQITDLKPLAGLTELERLDLDGNQITDLTPLGGLTKLRKLDIFNNPNLTQAEIDKLKKALPRCQISHNAKK